MSDTFLKDCKICGEEFDSIPQLDKGICDGCRDKDYIKVEPQDIETLINLLEGNTERQKIINYIREYIKPIK